MNLAKKFLVVLITAAMMFTLVPLAAFAADTTTPTTTEPVVATPAPTVPYADIFGTPYESAFIKLHLMGVFTGYSDQTFKPDRPVTRSEFLAVTIRALNFEKYVTGFKGATQYPDTAIDHWATGYINMGTAFGIIKGYPDGTFRPDGNVSYAEATTMLVRMLGYTQYLTPVTPGGGTEDWFANFVKMAVAMGDPTGYGLSVHPPLLYLPEGMLTGVQNFGAASPASRGDLAIMAYNAMYIFPLGQFEWHTNGPVPGGMYFPTNTTLAQNMGYYEMETFVTNAPEYDVYAGANQIELFEGWTVVLNDKVVFIPYGQGWTDPNGKFWGMTDPAAIAAELGLDYPADFRNVHRLYSIPSGSIWVGGKPAKLTDLIGKPLRVIYKGNEPYIGQEPDPNVSELWYIRILPHSVEKYQVAANKVGSYWYPGKTVGEILDTGTLRAYLYDPDSKSSINNLAIDPRAVIFLQDTCIDNPDVFLVKDAEIKVVRLAMQEKDYAKDYEGHMYGYIAKANQVSAILAQVWPGHIIKNAMPTMTGVNQYDKWGRVDVFAPHSFSFTDDRTFEKIRPTPADTPPSTVYSIVEDEAKILLGNTPYTMWNWYDLPAPLSGGVAYDAFDWYVTNYYAPGTAYFAPLKKTPIVDNHRDYTQETGNGWFSLVRYEGAENVKSGKLEEIYQTKDQWGNQWISSIKVSGTVYQVLPPGRGEFAVIAAAVGAGTVAEPTAPTGQVAMVESGATFASVSGNELVFNNLWDERSSWLSSSVDLILAYPLDNAAPYVRYMTFSTSQAGPVKESYNVVTNVNMINDVAGYHLSVTAMDRLGKVASYAFPEFTFNNVYLPDAQWIYVWAADDPATPVDEGRWEYVNVLVGNPWIAAYYGKTVFWADFEYYDEHNKGKFVDATRLVDVSNYSQVNAIWKEMQYMVRDLVKIDQYTSTTPNWTSFIELQALPLEGFINEVGPTFDATILSLQDTNNNSIGLTIPKADWGPQTIEERSLTVRQFGIKDKVILPWERWWGGLAWNYPERQPGTAIWDASMPAPNSPTPDGNILMRKMDYLQRQQYVQLFLYPNAGMEPVSSASNPANPGMMEWMLVNGTKVPVVPFAILRPILGSKLTCLSTWPGKDQIVTGAEFVGKDPQSGALNPIKAKFNQTLDTARSTMWVYNATTHLFINGVISFSSSNYPYTVNDVINFTPTAVPMPGSVPVPITLPDGTYLANVTAYDAMTNGSSSLDYAWTFTSQHLPAQNVDFSGMITATGGFTGPLEGAWVYASWGDGLNLQHVATTNANGGWLWTNAFDGYYSGVDVLFTIDATKATNTPPAPPPGWVTPWPVNPASIVKFAPYEGGSYTGMNFVVSFIANPS